MFHLSEVFLFFSHFGFFHFSPFSVVSFFTFFQVFQFLPFSDVSIFHLFRLFLCFSTVNTFFTLRSFLSYIPSPFDIVPQGLQILESFFYFQGFSTLRSFPTFVKTCSDQGFPGSRQFFLEGCRASKVWDRDPAHLRVCITHCSAKVISR